MIRYGATLFVVSFIGESIKGEGTGDQDENQFLE